MRGGPSLTLTLLACCTLAAESAQAEDGLVLPPVAIHGFVSPGWARQWPSEEVWKARKRGA